MISPREARHVARILHDRSYIPPVSDAVKQEVADTAKGTCVKLPIKHGTRYAYKTRGCKCELCMGANAAYSREIVQRNRQRVEAARGS